jgi:hypothetical protein
MRSVKRAVAIAGIAVAGTVFSLPSTAYAGAPTTSAAETYGPYRDEGTCNYWMYGVRAGGTPTTPCWGFGRWWYFQTVN